MRTSTSAQTHRHVTWFSVLDVSNITATSSIDLYVMQEEVTVVAQRCVVCRQRGPAAASCQHCAQYCSAAGRIACLHAFGKSKDNFRGGTVDKKRVNADLVARATLIIKGYDRSALALTLDGQDLGTSTALVSECGLHPDHIIVANPRLDPAKLHLPVNVVRGLVYDVIAAQSSSKPFAVVNLDYMCTANGNPHTRPRIDIHALFERRLFCPEGRPSLLVVQVAHARKATADEEPQRARQRQMQFAEWVADRANSHGFHVKLLTETDAYTVIHVFFFEVTTAAAV